MLHSAVKYENNAPETTVVGGKAAGEAGGEMDLLLLTGSTARKLLTKPALLPLDMALLTPVLACTVEEGFSDDMISVSLKLSHSLAQGLYTRRYPSPG